MQVKKRNGKLVKFDLSKIEAAIVKAYVALGRSINDQRSAQLTTKAMKEIPKSEIIDVEDIQDIVEKVLMENCPDIARVYILYREDRRKARVENYKNPLPDFIFHTKYGRPGEGYHNTIRRIEEMHKQRYPKLTEEIHEAFKYVHDKKVLPSMRSMQFAGPAILKHEARMYNCSFTLIDRTSVFGEIMYLLLCGCGVGFSVRKHHVGKLPVIKKVDVSKVEFYTISDTIEGWGHAIHKLVYGFSIGRYVDFDYSLIRSLGSSLSSGGVAPGHIPLKNCLENIRTVLSEVKNRQLTSLECHDIVCYIGEAVISGGIRRSSLISLFDYSDTEMLHCKSSENFFPGRLNNQRSMANNSVVFDRKVGDNKKEIAEVVAMALAGWGEPGYRIVEDPDEGCNPCGEIRMIPKNNKGKTGFAFCNLTEVNIAACETENEFYESCCAAGLIATLQGGYCNFNFLSEVSRDIALGNPAIGVSITGIWDNTELSVNPNILRMGRFQVRKTNAQIAKKVGLHASLNVTCIKPSGTASLLLDTSSGIHPRYAKKYFRRIIVSSKEPATALFLKNNPHMIESIGDGSQYCITFPMKSPDYKKPNCLELLNVVQLYNDNWIGGHSVSCTIPVEENLRKQFIKELCGSGLNGVCVIGDTFDKKFPNAPFEAVVTQVDIDKWDMLIHSYKQIDWGKTGVIDFGNACEGGLCGLGGNE